jgi:hypothetical protein
MNWLGQIISGVVSPITSIFEARQKRKQAAEQAEAKIKLAKQQGDQELSLKDQEWEALAIKATEGTWKDELITLVFMGVFVIFIFGGLAAAFGFPGRLTVWLSASTRSPQPVSISDSSWKPSSLPDWVSASGESSDVAKKKPLQGPDQPTFKTPQAAAISAMRAHNRTSIKTNKERWA